MKKIYIRYLTYNGPSRLGSIIVKVTQQDNPKYKQVTIDLDDGSEIIYDTIEFRKPSSTNSSYDYKIHNLTFTNGIESVVVESNKAKFNYSNEYEMAVNSDILNEEVTTITLTKNFKMSALEIDLDLNFIKEEERIADVFLELYEEGMDTPTYITDLTENRRLKYSIILSEDKVKIYNKIKLRLKLKDGKVSNNDSIKVKTFSIKILKDVE